jgi:hypothetical protein
LSIFYLIQELMPMATTIPRHRSGRQQQPELFLPPATRPTWDQLTEPCRREVRGLIARLLIAHVAADLRVPAELDQQALLERQQQKEVDHE